MAFRIPGQRPAQPGAHFGVTRQEIVSAAGTVRRRLTGALEELPATLPGRLREVGARTRQVRDALRDPAIRQGLRERLAVGLHSAADRFQQGLGATSKEAEGLEEVASLDTPAAAAASARSDGPTSVRMSGERLMHAGRLRELERLLSPEYGLTSLSIDGSEIDGDTVRSLAALLSRSGNTLTSLTLYNTSIGDDVGFALAEALHSEYCQLTSLSLTDNLMRGEGRRSLLAALPNANCKLTSLDLSGEIDDDTLCSLTDVLRDPANKLTSLQLKDAKLKSGRLATLLAALGDSNCKVTSLGLRRSGIAHDEARDLASLLLDPSCRLTSLDLSENRGLTSTGVAELASAIPWDRFQSLLLHGTSCGDVGLISITHGLANTHSALKTLDVSSCGIGATTARKFAQVLRNPNCSLTRLNVSLNKDIGDEGAIAFADSLCDANCKLTELDLTSIDMGESGGCAIGDALSNEHCALTSLRISLNPVGPRTAQSIARALCSAHCKLKNLEAGFANFGDTGVQELAGALTHENCRLTSLAVPFTGIRAEGARAIAEAIAHPHCRLQTLEMEMNSGLDEVEVAMLVDAFSAPSSRLHRLQVSADWSSPATRRQWRQMLPPGKTLLL